MYKAQKCKQKLIAKLLFDCNTSKKHFLLDEKFLNTQLTYLAYPWQQLPILVPDIGQHMPQNIEYFECSKVGNNQLVNKGTNETTDNSSNKDLVRRLTIRQLTSVTISNPGNQETKEWC